MSRPLRFAAFVAALFALAVYATQPAPASASLGGAPSPASFTYQPGGAAAPGVYTSWSSLYAAASRVRCPVVVVDGSASGGNATVPTGTYDFDCWTIISNNAADLTFSDGAHVSLCYSMAIDFGATMQIGVTSSPTFTSPAGCNPQIILRGTSYLWTTAGATQPLILATGGSYYSIVSAEPAGIGTSGSGPLMEVDDGGTGDILLGAGAYLGASSLAGVGTYAVTFPAAADATISGTQPDAGGLILWYTGPVTTAAFGASAGLTTASAQNIPPSATATTLVSADNLGILTTAQGSCNNFYVSYTGSSSNVSGQTVSFQCARNGSNVSGLGVSGLATTAGVHSYDTAAAEAGAQCLSARGDIWICHMTNSAPLSAVLTDITVAIGPTQ
jgi:hypothetical protein